MYVIEGAEDKTLHWGAAIDEGYGEKPYIDFCLCIGKRPYQRKLCLKKDNWELRGIAGMLRHLADSIEKNVDIYESRLASKSKMDENA